MAQNSKIEWTHHTANLWWGCSKVHEGCDNCYAETLSKRFGDDVWGVDKERRAIKSVWKDLDKYQRAAKKSGQIHRVFVGSMMDIFEKPMPLVDSKGCEVQVDCNGKITQMQTSWLRDELFARIKYDTYPNLMFLLLTKRPSNINKYIPESWKVNPPKNVMFGISISTQKNANDLIPQILEVKGKRFLSVEPQLEDIDFGKVPTRVVGYAGIDWVIQGGESGHNKRPFNIYWAYSMKAQCKDANVPYFFKQIDKVQPIPDDLLVREFPPM